MKQNKAKQFFQKALGMLLLLISNSFLFGLSAGDVNGDSVVNVVDALMVAQVYVGQNPSPYYPEAADVDCSGRVDIVDALQIVRYYIGIIDSLCLNSTATPMETIIPTPTATPRPLTSLAPRLDNPFEGAKMYVDPVWSEKAMSSGGEAIALESTAINLDRIGAITDGIGLRGHLDNAIAQNADLITLVLNDIPYKNCASGYLYDYSYPPENKMNYYKNDFIDPIVAILDDPRYKDLRVVCIIEPNSLSNLITNLFTSDCAAANGPGGIAEGIQYALNELNTLGNTYCYVSIESSSWMGWPDNLKNAIQIYGNTIKGSTNGVNSISGFISNFGYYTPVEEPFLPDPQLEVGGKRLVVSGFYEWNPYFDELDYAQDFRQAMIDIGFPESIGMLIDTSRNGWGGPDRPTAVSTSTDLDTYVDESRIDRRYHRGNWCNQPGGIGYRPQANPHPGIDAYVWGLAPGISDGVSDANFEPDPDDPSRYFDPNCDPNGISRYDNGVPTGAIDAPHQGRWNQKHFEILLKNAYPPLESRE
ncbi:MAG: glycoside hydrolase family 6 protein [Spirochaetales bacterium]|nr:glycoside hydrolase family 6 protein [Spirochaetales bacterium]